MRRRGAPRATRRAPPGRVAGPCRARPPARSPARAGATSPARGPALGLRDDLVRDHEHVAVGERRRSSAGPRRSARRGRRRATISGRPSSAASRAQAPAHQLAEHAARVRRAAAVARARCERLEVLGRVDVERQRGHLDHLRGDAGGRARWPGGAAQLPGPNDGASASGGVSSSAFVPVPWRSGTISADGGVDRSREQLLELVGVEQRAVAGDEQHALGAVLERGADALARRRRCGPARRPRSRSRRSRPRSAERRGRALTTSDLVDARSSPQRDEHVARTSPRRALGAAARRARREPLLGLREALDRAGSRAVRIGAKRYTEQPSANRSVSSATRRRAVGVVHQHVRLEHRHRVGRARRRRGRRSGPRSSSAMPVAGQRLAGPRHERLGRALDDAAADQRADRDDRRAGCQRARRGSRRPRGSGRSR